MSETDSHMITELVPCLHCQRTGIVRHWLLFTRDCQHCQGTGSRKLMFDQRMPADIVARLRRESIDSLNSRSPSAWETLLGQTLRIFT